MPKRIAVSTLNASTIDILNTIRANASMEYQDLVPEVTQANEIPKVGEVLYGYPALANQFINALVNRIALVRVKSAVFNNAYAELKKGYLEFGETVEEVFVNITKAREFSAEKAESRELKRSLPDVRSAFHAMNWRVQYPVTIQDMDLRQAFLSIDGVQDLIARIVDAVYTAAEYDEYLLFKYLIIKAVSHGKMYPKAVDTSDMDNAAIAFRSASNALTFMSTKYNVSGVHTTTPKRDQYIFMSADFNARYDVKVLAAAFNMDEVTFAGHLRLIDDFTTFDSERFDIINTNTDMLPPITDEELALMKDVVAVITDAEWFQVYDNQNKFTEKYVASGEYWNYFYNVWKTVSSSPFSNAIAFISTEGGEPVPDVESFTVEIMSKSVSEEATVLTLGVQDDDPGFAPTDLRFVQTQDATEKGVAIHPYGAVIIPSGSTDVTLVGTLNGVEYTAGAVINEASTVGETVTMTKAAG